MRTNGRTDGLIDMTETIVVYRGVGSVPKNGTLSKHSKNHKYNNNNNNNNNIIVVFFAVCLVDQAALSKFFFVTHTFLMPKYTSTVVM